MADFTEMAPQKTYLGIGVEGTFRKQVPEGTEGAKKREIKKDDGSVIVKWELHTNLIENAKILDVFVRDTDYGEQLNIALDDDIVISTPLSGNYSTSFLKALPYVDFNEEVILRSYSIETDKGKTKKGISLMQKGEKLTNFFYDYEEKKNLHSFPDPHKEKMTKDDWKVYFINVKQFLQSYLEENIKPKLDKIAAENMVEPKEEPEEGSIESEFEDQPF